LKQWWTCPGGRRRDVRGWACVVSVVLGLAILLPGCSETGTETSSGSSDLPEQMTYDYRTTQTRGGVPEWELWGTTAERYPGRPEMRLTNVRMVFYKNGVKDAELTADTGEVDDETKNTVARGHVVVINEAGNVLKSEVLYWDNARQLIHTDQFVRFEDGDQVLTGTGLETDPNLTNLVILDQFSGEIPVESAPSGDEGKP
jgi:LPS export ABC transporter protein LptC